MMPASFGVARRVTGYRKVEAAYRRGDLLEKRRLLSKAWGDFCLGLTPLAASNLIPFPAPVSRNRAATAATSPQKGGRRLPPAAQLAFDL
jgi:hypothetical protein